MSRAHSRQPGRSTAKAGEHYVATAVVEARHGKRVCLRLRERLGRSASPLQGAAPVPRADASSFARFATARRNGSRLTASVSARPRPRSQPDRRVERSPLGEGASRRPATTSAASATRHHLRRRRHRLLRRRRLRRPPPPPAGPAFGVQFHCGWNHYDNASRAAVLDKLKAAGVQWVRIDFAWDGIEDADKGARNSWYIGMMDNCVNLARARGINVLMTLWLTPAWANGGQSNRVPPTNPQDYADFARWAATYWRGRVGAWEVWNEPDPYESFFQGTVAQYAGDSLRTPTRAFKAGDPNALVLVGGPSSNDDAWLSRLYGLGVQGLLRRDGHAPVPGHGRRSAGDTPTTATAGGSRTFPRCMHGDGRQRRRRKPIWFTEFGWSAHANWQGIQNWQRGVTAAAAGRLPRPRASASRRRTGPTWTRCSGTRSAAYPGSQDVHEEGYALLDSNLAERPVYWALKSYLVG